MRDTRPLFRQTMSSVLREWRVSLLFPGVGYPKPFVLMVLFQHHLLHWGGVHFYPLRVWALRAYKSNSKVRIENRTQDSWDRSSLVKLVEYCLECAVTDREHSTDSFPHRPEQPVAFEEHCLPQVAAKPLAISGT